MIALKECLFVCTNVFAYFQKYATSIIVLKVRKQVLIFSLEKLFFFKVFKVSVKS